MVDLIVTDRIHNKIRIHSSPVRFIAKRPLTNSEISLAKALKWKKYYYQELKETDRQEFFFQFDAFWDEVIKVYGHNEPFWRSAFSSKMQEWERSLAYLLLEIFTLSKTNIDNNITLVVICSSIQEEDFFEQYGKQMDWKTYLIPASPIPKLFRLLLQRLKLFYKFLRIFFLFCYYKLVSPALKFGHDPGQEFVLICSLIYKHSFANGHYTDPFLGDLHRRIQKRGLPAVNLVYPLENYKNTVDKISSYRKAIIHTPLSVIGWGRFIKTIKEVLGRNFPDGSVFFLGCSLTKLIQWHLQRELFFNLHSELFYQAVKEICRFYRFNRMIFPYEGNAFERSIIQAFRFYGKGNIIGYSHAVVYPLNIKIRLTAYEQQLKPLPDMLITTGTENTKLFKSVTNHNPGMILDGCALKAIPEISNLKSAKGTTAILTALDGVWSTISVLDWLIDNAEYLSEYEIIIRCHPNVPLEAFKEGYRNFPANFTFSNQNLKDDFEKSLCIIYRQTSVGLQALMNSIPVIHLNVDAPLPCDPIKKLHNGKWVASNIEQLMQALNEIRILSDEKRIQAMEEAREYAQNYFQEPNDKLMNQFLSG